MDCGRSALKVRCSVSVTPFTSYESLHHSIVRVVVTTSDDESWGTGFFVAPGRVVTCAHVIATRDGALLGDLSIVRPEEPSVKIPVFAESVHAAEYPDLALLRVVTLTAFSSQHPIIPLDPSVHPRDKVYTYAFGKTDTRKPGASVTAEVEGWAQPGGDGPHRGQLIQLKAGQIVPGVSGAPLLNLRTGKVCGVLKGTRDLTADLGGWAISASEIQARFASVLGYATASSRLVPIPPCQRYDLAPKLYDREEPDEDFSAAFFEQLGPGPCTRAYFVFGEEREQHGSFAKRVRHTSAQFIADGHFRQTQAAIDEIGNVEWPRGNIFSPSLIRSLELNLARAAEVKDRFTTAGDMLAKRPGYGSYPIVFITHTLKIERWGKAQQQLLEWYLDNYWNEATRRTDSPYVVLLLLVESAEVMNARTARDWLFFWRGCAKDQLKRSLRLVADGRTRQQRVRRWLQVRDNTPNATTGPSRPCSRILLRDLTPLQLKHIADWFENHLAKRARLGLVKQ